MPDPDLPQLGERMGEINNAGRVRPSAIDKRPNQRATQVKSKSETCFNSDLDH